MIRSVFVLWLAPALCAAQTLPLHLADAYPGKARYSPAEPVQLTLEYTGHAQGTEEVGGTVWQLDRQVGQCAPAKAAPDPQKKQSLLCTVPAKDFQGYRVEVQLKDAAGRIADTRSTAIDVSSDWKRFPRYGYLAHYSAAEGTQPATWMDELNRFHINGLEFYDFQFRHDQPLAGTVGHPQMEWKDIAGRPIDGHVVMDLITEAHRHNMMAMAYNASYSAYDDVFTRKHDPLPIEWATWDSPNGPRTAATAKRLELHAANWSTHSLFYMNQNSPAWQNYIFGQMRDLFSVYPFDGWHVDTFGEKGAYAFDRSYVDYIAGFPPYINHAHDFLHKRIVFNAVNTFGQERIALSSADFVYSELWEDHETFASLLSTAEQVHLANPRDGIVFAAYVHRLDTKERESRPAAQFNPAAVLLTDAAIFSAGASHIELGDGDRMLSSEYFPADTRLTVSPALREDLRHYYDYLTAYENYLRDEMSPAAVRVSVAGYPSDPMGIPQSLWTIAREKNGTTVVHLINLLGSSDPHWRDAEMKRPEPPLLKGLHLEISGAADVRSAGWASPDVDGGRFHAIPFEVKGQGRSASLRLTLPELRYWDTIFLSR
jgi:dextranase